MNLETLRNANIARNNDFGSYEEWTLDQWMTLLVEEVGETARALRQLNEIRVSYDHDNFLNRKVDLIEEIADVVICADLLAMACDIDLSSAITTKFNKTSAKRGSKVTL